MIDCCATLFIYFLPLLDCCLCALQCGLKYTSDVEYRPEEIYKNGDSITTLIISVDFILARRALFFLLSNQICPAVLFDTSQLYNIAASGVFVFWWGEWGTLRTNCKHSLHFFSFPLEKDKTRIAKCHCVSSIFCAAMRQYHQR